MKEIKFEVAMKLEDGAMCLPCDIETKTGDIYFLRNENHVHAWHCNFVNIKDSSVLGIRKYAGFKDINKKRIFTGDIVKLKFNGNYYTTQIEFLQNSFFNGFVYTHREIKHPFLKYPAEICEIIGDVYNNPKMLEDK